MDTPIKNEFANFSNELYFHFNTDLKGVFRYQIHRQRHFQHLKASISPRFDSFLWSFPLSFATLAIFAIFTAAQIPKMATISKTGLQQSSTSVQTSVPTREITLTERMISACSGSVLTSLLVTPLDVVRVRLQQQEILLPASNCCKRQVFWSEAGCSTQADSVCITEKKMHGTFRSMLQIAQKEGVVTLWRGLSLTLLMAAPSNIVYFTGYEILRDNSPLKNYGAVNPLVCGSIARILAATAVSPIELLRTRLQAIPKQDNVMRNLLNNLSTEFRSKGPGILFKGLTLTLWRDVPFSGVYWASYEHIKALLHTHCTYNLVQGPQNEQYNLFLHSFISGSLSGSIAAIFTNPFDVGKTRLQISSDSDTTVVKKHKSMASFMKDIIKYEGIGALYVGLLPRLLKIAPSCAIMISSYEIGKRFFATAITDPLELEEF